MKIHLTQIHFYTSSRLQESYISPVLNLLRSIFFKGQCNSAQCLHTPAVRESNTTLVTALDWIRKEQQQCRKQATEIQSLCPWRQADTASTQLRLSSASCQFSERNSLSTCHSRLAATAQNQWDTTQKAVLLQSILPLYCCSTPKLALRKETGSNQNHMKNTQPHKKAEVSQRLKNITETTLLAHKFLEISSGGGAGGSKFSMKAEGSSLKFRCNRGRELGTDCTLTAPETRSTHLGSLPTKHTPLTSIHICISPTLYWN